MQHSIPMKAKMVFVSTEVPEEVAKKAQVAIVTEMSWHLIGPGRFRAHGFNRGVSLPMPAVKCPVVDVSLVEEQATAVLKRYLHPTAGIKDVPALLEELKMLGADISLAPPPTPPQKSAKGGGVFGEGSKRRIAKRVQ